MKISLTNTDFFDRGFIFEVSSDAAEISIALLANGEAVSEAIGEGAAAIAETIVGLVEGI